jgi:hypothetical protein
MAAASDAPQINSKHVKSLLRRAKARHHHALALPGGAFGTCTYTTAQVERDLQQIINMHIGAGVVKQGVAGRRGAVAARRNERPYWSRSGAHSR